MKTIRLLFTLSFLFLLSIESYSMVAPSTTIIPTACATTTYNIGSLSSADFYDDGGAGGAPCADQAGGGNYSNSNCFTRTTICAPAGEFIVIDFSEFAMWNTTSGWDWMKIYDNNAASGTLLYDNSSSGVDNPFGDCGIGATTMNFCSTGQCLTFEFWATSVVNRAGWEAVVTAVSASCILPVELVNFSGDSYKNSNLLNWSVATEINNDYYILERSANGVDFEYLAKIEGAGNSADLLNYTYPHQNPRNIEYYRLKQVDFDGVYSYSKVIVVKSKDYTKIEIYPNPTKGNFSFDILNKTSDEVYTIKYTDLTGRQKSEQISILEGSHSYNVENFRNLPAGIYFIQIQRENGEIIHSKKIIKH